VSVGNTAANAVPVQQQGTATVNVSNASLPVTGTVKIDPTGNPAQTQAADNPAFQPVHAIASTAAGDGVFDVSGVAYTVPADKELVVEYVSFALSAPPTDAWTNGYLSTTSGGLINFVNLDGTVTPVTNTDTVTSGGQTVRLYYPPGSDLACTFERAPAVSFGDMSCDISGYLVSLP
jgi:hypothetical protein